MSDFGPGATQSILTGLADSLAKNFKEEHDRRTKEDAQRKDTDYGILMAALEQMKPNLTPTQVSEIMTRAVDIFKPKGHGKVKDQIKMIFGGGEGQYQMQGAGIIKDVTSEPRKMVQPEQVQGEGIRPRTATRPAPLQQEQTYREQDISDEQRKYSFQLEKQREQNQLMMDRQYQLESQRQRNRLDLSDHNLKNSISKMSVGAQLKAQAKFQERRGMIASSMPNASPEEVDAATWDSLKDDVELHQSMIKENIAASKQRQTESENRIRQANERIAQAEKRLEISKSKTPLDPQVKTLQSQAKEFMAVATQVRRYYSMAMSKAAGATSSADREQAYNEAQGFLNAAEENEKAAQGVANEIESRLGSTGTAPLSPRKASSSNKSGAKLTEKEIRDAGGSDADVEEARRKGVLVKP